MADAPTQTTNASRKEQGTQRASMKAVGVYDRPARRVGLARPLPIVLLILAFVSVIILVKSLF